MSTLSSFTRLYYPQTQPLPLSMPFGKRNKFTASPPSWLIATCAPSVASSHISNYHLGCHKFNSSLEATSNTYVYITSFSRNWGRFDSSCGIQEKTEWPPGYSTPSQTNRYVFGGHADVGLYYRNAWRAWRRSTECWRKNHSMRTMYPVIHGQKYSHSGRMSISLGKALHAQSQW